MAYPLHDDAARGVPASPDLPAIERGVLAYWEADRTFEASVAQRPAGERGSNEYVFYDGPPFANGLPHWGGLFTGYVKDVIPRYQTMRGRRVERRFGWDCHGLPAEVEAEKQLGISTKAEILDMGVEKFNDACRTLGCGTRRSGSYVTARPGGWTRQRPQDARPDYMESVMWASRPCTTRV